MQSQDTGLEYDHGRGVRESLLCVGELVLDLDCLPSGKIRHSDGQEIYECNHNLWHIWRRFAIHARRARRASSRQTDVILLM